MVPLTEFLDCQNLANFLSYIGFSLSMDSFQLHGIFDSQSFLPSDFSIFKITD